MRNTKNPMKTIPFRCDESRHKALLGMAKASGTSMQKLFDQSVTEVLTERPVKALFAARQAGRNLVRGRRYCANCWLKCGNAFPQRRSKGEGREVVAADGVAVGRECGGEQASA